MKSSNVKRSGGSLVYCGVSFPGFNKPRASANPKKKKMVLAKKGDDVKVVHFGDASMGHNYSAPARKSYLARSAGIPGKVLWAGPKGSKKAPPSGSKFK